MAATQSETRILEQVEAHERGEEELVLNVADLQRVASRKMGRVVEDFFNSGAMYQTTYNSNTAAFDRFILRPRVLTDVTSCDTSTTLFGRRIPFPLAISPTAFHKLAHPDGELATARGAAAFGTTMALSSYANHPWPAIAREAAGRIDFIAQLYIYPNRDLITQLVRTAEEAGFKAIFLTSDAPVLGTRWNETRNGFVRYVAERFDMRSVCPNLQVGGEGGEGLDKERTRDAAAAFQDPGHNWARDIPFLRSITKMRIFIKGILTAEDVELAITHGVDGILVSNHGGRQLDGGPATLDALVECAEAARGRIPLFLDGGVRRGRDVFTALALGAQCVFVGRPVLWGLAYDGAAGVEKVLRMLHDEFAETMRLMGCTSVADITRSRLSVRDSLGMLRRLEDLQME